MQSRRNVQRERDLCSGPGKLAQALAIELDHNGSSLVNGPISICAPTAIDASYEVVASPRIGITKAVDLDWRFYARGVEHVSGKRT